MSIIGSGIFPFVTLIVNHRVSPFSLLSDVVLTIRSNIFPLFRLIDNYTVNLFPLCRTYVNHRVNLLLFCQTYCKSQSQSFSLFSYLLSIIESIFFSFQPFCQSLSPFCQIKCSSERQYFFSFRLIVNNRVNLFLSCQTYC